jgi:hypothetical protein
MIRIGGWCNPWHPLREWKLLIDGSILLGRDTRLRMRGYDSQTASAFKNVAKKKL